MQDKSEMRISLFFAPQRDSDPTLDTSASIVSKQKLHPAKEYLYQLQQLPPSTQLTDFLLSFNIPRPINAETFAEGVKKFIQLANSNPFDTGLEHSRSALYGNPYSGIHYNNDLIKLWNVEHRGEEPLTAPIVATLAPAGWDPVNQDGFFTLIYKGQQPAQALDLLVKGPTVIDCGMFSQLSLWFGIRYMLGNERFNQCFGRSPFFITQLVYNAIESSDEPYFGNPLYSFLSKKEETTTPSVRVKHLKNTPLYPLKHPGGNYGGENCILIEEHYYIFDPYLQRNQGITASEVSNLLCQAFNEDRLQCDTDRLSIYAENPEKFHPKLLRTYGQLIEAAEKYRDVKLSEEEFLGVKQDVSLDLSFDLHKFLIWLQRMEYTTQIEVTYVPLPIDYSAIPPELLSAIPFENKTSMDFLQFQQSTLQQQQLLALSKRFCQSIMADESQLVILSGKAGVGKTASAVCAAKELAVRGKKVVWISEVMVNGWAEQAKSIADLDNCRLEIDRLLATNPDAVFLDDDNLAGFSGTLLLEKIYSWYVGNSGKGLFITSNEMICFNECYGYKLDQKYHYPPFSDYSSSQYLNRQQKTDLAGDSLRLRREGQSIGAIVSVSSWEINEAKLGQVELIPAFDESDELAPIRRKLRETGSMQCNVYDHLRPIQQQWLHVSQVGDEYIYKGSKLCYESPHLTVNPSKFEQTPCKTIALEMKERHSMCSGKIIDENTMDQFIRVLNYVHDQGGRRVIVINQTSFSNEQLLLQIKEQLPSSERERSWSRLMLLLCETDDTIFGYDQFKGSIKNSTPPVQANKIEMNINCLPSYGKRFVRVMDYELEHPLKKGVYGMTTFFTKFLIEHRHDSGTLQHEYDKRFGMVLRK